MRHFLPHCEVTSDGVMCVCLPVTVFVSLSVTEKSTFENINLVLSVISIITVPGKLLQMVRGCLARFAVVMSVCLSHLFVYPEFQSLR